MPNNPMTSNNQTKKSGFAVMRQLLKLVSPFALIMMITISMGILGFLTAIGITVVGAIGILNQLDLQILPLFNELKAIYITLIIFAIARGILRYLEQSSGHYIAFKLLAFVRDKVFKALRKLAPSKLDEKDNGQLIALITSDIELLEVFYAHTIAPIVIAILTCTIMLSIIAYYSIPMAFVALMAYITIGYIIPYFTAKSAREAGRIYREKVGDLNQYFLESLRGMREIILFDEGKARHDEIQRKSAIADQSVEKIKAHEGITKAITETALLSFSALMLFVGIILCQNSNLNFDGFFVSLICLMSSYGPVVALSNLSNNLLQTLASGERVLALLEEIPTVSAVTNGKDITSTSIKVENLSFAYKDSSSDSSALKDVHILKDLSLDFKKGQIIGISGKSGCGKSTLLKLIMHFYEAQNGKISIGGTNVNNINTSSLRQNMAYVTQDTYLFDSTLEENLRIAKRDATTEELIEACKKANLYDFIQTLPNGFKTKVGELGDSLSGGERQRIGIARAFLHDSPIILLDEPTSNLDSLNESIILNALKAHSKDKTIILVSHRQSTMSIADQIYYMEERRAS